MPVQYGYGCLDGQVNGLVLDEGKAFLVAVDLGAHIARHIYNSLRSVEYRTVEQIGTLEEAIKLGRNYDSDYKNRLATRTGEIGFREYFDIYIRLMFENMNQGFVHGNYVRPFYAPCDERIDGEQTDFQINGRIYKKTLTIMMLHWPALLVPRVPTFDGLNVLLTTSSASPYPGTSLIEYKAESSYAPTRGPAVEEKNQFNDRFGKELIIHEVLIFDHSRKFAREGSGSNLFLYDPRSRTFYTPYLDGSIFPGLTRDFVMRLIKGEFGETLNLKVQELNFDDKFIGDVAKHGGELFLTGSALGVVSARRLIVRNDKKSGTLTDYDIIEFERQPESPVSRIGDCYRCFSSGNGAEIKTKEGTVRMTEFSSWSVMFEVPKELATKAKEAYTSINGTRLDLPTDQILRSGKVIAITPRERRVVTKGDYDRRKKATV
ncbi:MAG: aminotransferase class IV [Candidatus Micrarchaeota archaeon]|nr:aminotransferase class IV [Candidatus Micrarchaeota archaeon]